MRSLAETYHSIEARTSQTFFKRGALTVTDFDFYLTLQKLSLASGKKKKKSAKKFLLY